MIPLLPPLQLPWQQIPVRKVPQSPLLPRPPLRTVRCCWNCGRTGVSFCEVAYLNAAAIAPCPPARPVTP